MMMEREQIAALEQQEHLLKQSNDGANNGSSLAPPSTIDTISSKVTTYSSSLTPSAANTRSLDQRKYSSGFDTRKYSSSADPYRKYSSVSGYGGRSYLNPSSGYNAPATYGGTSNQHMPMIDDK